MGDSGDLSSQEVSLLARERGVRVDGGVEVASEDMLDLSRCLDVSRGGVRKLDPVLKEAVIDPVHVLVYTLAAALVGPVATLLLCLVEDTLNNPVILLDTVELAPESQSGGTAESR